MVRRWDWDLGMKDSTSPLQGRLPSSRGRIYVLRVYISSIKIEVNPFSPLMKVIQAIRLKSPILAINYKNPASKFYGFFYMLMTKALVQGKVEVVEEKISLLYLNYRFE